MYIDYRGLWKLLIDKNMTKTDLIELTGISSRVLAKLSKNETVTTDTIARICAALDCSVCDIMECVEDETMSLYNRYRRLGEAVSENELYRTVRFTAGGKNYTVHTTKKNATKATHIHCKDDGAIYWEQFYILGGRSTPAREEHLLIKPRRESDELVIVLIKGKPSMITGLDEGIFVSSKCRLRSRADIYVMSEAEFKIFEQ